MDGCRYSKVVRLRNTHTSHTISLKTQKPTVCRLWLSEVRGHLVVPRLPTQHLRALEAGGVAAGGEDGATLEESHVDALAEVDEHQSVVHAVWIQIFILQKSAGCNSNKGA